jgi:hypothetical protein
MVERLLQLLLYADDLALLANTKHQLQNMLRVLADFCDEYDLEVNVPKCTVVVVGKRTYQGSWCGLSGIEMAEGGNRLYR